MGLMNRETNVKSSELSKLLIPCPFCGSDKLKITTISKGADKGDYYQGLCNKCYARGPKTSNLEEAVKLWNGRAYKLYKPAYKVNKEQLNKFLNGEILLKCSTLTEYITLMYDCQDKLSYIEGVENSWHEWFKYKENTVVNIRVNTNRDYDRLYGYGEADWYKQNYTLKEMQDIKLEETCV